MEDSTRLRRPVVGESSRATAAACRAAARLPSRWRAQRAGCCKKPCLRSAAPVLPAWCLRSVARFLRQVLVVRVAPRTLLPHLLRPRGIALFFEQVAEEQVGLSLVGFDGHLLLLADERLEVRDRFLRLAEELGPERVAHRFREAGFPVRLVGLRYLVEHLVRLDRVLPLALVHLHVGHVGAPRGHLRGGGVWGGPVLSL